jgi:NAD(P)-dependent dehydrogenase (short-subunit alcohol dehydrogenase family)
MKFSHQTILIVGGSSGIGFATAKAAQAQGATVILIGRSLERLQQAQAEIGSQASIAQADVEDEASVEAAFSRIESFDHLFISAQDVTTAPLAQTTKARLRPTIDSKIWGALHVVKHAVTRLHPSGSITFISGLAGRRGYAGMAVAGAANAGIEAVARNLAIELAPVRVNTVCAGVIDTTMLDRVFGDRREQKVNEIAQSLPVKRIGTTEDIADAILFVMGNGFITGTRLLIDGGDALV